MSSAVSLDDVLQQKLRDDPEFREAYEESERATENALWFSEKLREADTELKRLRAIAAQWAEYTQWRDMSAIGDDWRLENVWLLFPGKVERGYFVFDRYGKERIWCDACYHDERVVFPVGYTPLGWLPEFVPEAPKGSKG